MEMFSINASLFWFLLGIFFMVLEAVTPGFFLMFFGLGAWATSAVLFFVPSLGQNLQWIIFIAVSVASLLIFRRKLKSFFRGRLAGDDNMEDAVLRDQYIGREVLILEDVCAAKPGLAEFNGTNWQARTEGPAIAAGERATVIRIDGLTLILEPRLPKGGGHA